MRTLLDRYIENDILSEALARILSFAAEMLVVYALWRILKAAIAKYRRKSHNSRSGTVAGIMDSVLKYGSYFFVTVMALETLFKINVMSIVAAAGVAGVAVAFGAQSIVKDVITGFFVIFEGEYKVGDLVTIDSFTGTVENITLRCTTIKNYMGDVYIVPNGSVEKIINHQRDGRYLSLEVEIAYESDIDAAMEILKSCGEKAEKELAEVIGPPQVLGVVAWKESGVKLRTLIPCVPGGQFAAEREMLKRVKEAFDENGIEIPYNRLVVIQHTKE